MTISEIIKKMIEYSQGNLHDINHFIKVYTYARIIGECEKLDETTQAILEVSAIVHDIACPLCREKYGNSDGKYQEIEGSSLTREFLKNTGYSNEFIERVVFLVEHHHTIENIKGMDYQILIEADYIVNADESNYSKSNIENTMNNIFKTKTGIELLKSNFFFICILFHYIITKFSCHFSK